jgi:hypothetical protein
MGEDELDIWTHERKTLSIFDEVLGLWSHRRQGWYMERMYHLA